MKLGSILGFSLVFLTLTGPAMARDAFDRAKNIIKQHRLLTPTARRCSMLVLRDGSNQRIGMVGVYEVHNDVCGGDPQVAHRIFDLEIDMKTGAAKWDRNFPYMEMRPIPRRKSTSRRPMARDHQTHNERLVTVHLIVKFVE